MRRRLMMVLGLLLALVLVGAGWWWQSGRPAGTPQAQELSGTELPARLTDASVLAVGEATHGTADFREAWRLIALQAAGKGFSTIVLEENAGSTSQVDAWLQGGPGTAEQAAKRFGFRLNRTRETAQLLTSLREWNQAHPQQAVHLYGLDMQRPVQDRDVVLAWLRRVDPQAARRHGPQLTGITDDTAYDAGAGARFKPLVAALLADVEAAAAGRSDDATLRARLSARALAQGMERAAVGVSGYDRDADLHANLDLLVQQRAKAGGQHALLLAHDAHVSRVALSRAPGSHLGVLNAQRWGEHYRVIGADAHHVRLQDGGQVHSFDVRSPVRGIFRGTTIGFLDLGQAIQENREVLGRRVPLTAGGSPFQSWAAWVPFFHQVSVVHQQAWDALVYVEDSRPTSPLPR
ncbi:erythromycin esterase family protein [Luteococcus peritonei]|uniref:Erythromycin esterase family protein n=1 Tax=Luteococcus peritonei TaxID=88874 RepID=A0ABW4RY69_9ACTN